MERHMNRLLVVVAFLIGCAAATIWAEDSAPNLYFTPQMLVMWFANPSTERIKFFIVSTSFTQVIRLYSSSGTA